MNTLFVAVNRRGQVEHSACQITADTPFLIRKLLRQDPIIRPSEEAIEAVSQAVEKHYRRGVWRYDFYGDKRQIFLTILPHPDMTYDIKQLQNLIELDRIELQKYFNVTKPNNPCPPVDRPLGTVLEFQST